MSPSLQCDQARSRHGRHSFLLIIKPNYLWRVDNTRARSYKARASPGILTCQCERHPFGMEGSASLLLSGLCRLRASGPPTKKQSRQKSCGSLPAISAHPDTGAGADADAALHNTWCASVSLPFRDKGKPFSRILEIVKLRHLGSSHDKFHPLSPILRFQVKMSLQMCCTFVRHPHAIQHNSSHHSIHLNSIVNPRRVSETNLSHFH